MEIPTFKYEKIELLVCIYEISKELVFIYGISACSRCLTPATILNPIPFYPKFIWDSYSQANWSSKCSPLKWWLIHTYGEWQTVLRLIVHHSHKSKCASKFNWYADIEFLVCKCGFFQNTTYSNTIFGKRPSIQIWISGAFY